jgi:fatty acid desaturase
MEIKLGDDEKSSETQDKEVLLARERRKIAEMIGVVAIIVAACGFGALFMQPTWPVAVGVFGVFWMVASIASKMLKRD